MRLEDAERYVLSLRRGREVPVPRYLASPVAPFEHWVEKLRLPTERHILPGVGWQEYLRFASPATGRAFCARIPLEDFNIEPTPKVVLFHSQDDVTPRDCFVDLLETLAIDRSDLDWLADDVKTIELATWTLWRQDDNGNKAQMRSFTGYRKARAELARLEALGHKQTYWLDGPTP